MADKDKDLTNLFVRHLDDVKLPPRDRWRPATRKESSLMKSSRFALYAGGVTAVLAAALIIGLALGDRTSQVASSPSPTAATSTPVPATTAPASPSPTATASPSSPPPTVAATGAITGALQFPSNFIPPVTVYAIGGDDQRVWFSVETPRYPLATNTPPQPSYTINGVAPGTYWVVAYRNDGQKPDPGVYTRQAECLRRTPSGPCPDQTPVLVTVTAGQTTREIDIVTWYPGSGLMPPPPPRPTVFGPSECTSPTATTRQVIERYLALSTSNNAQAVSDCFAKIWRDKTATFADDVAVWSRSGPATNVVISPVDVVNGCDRFNVKAQMSNPPSSTFQVPPFFSVGPEGGRMRIYETSTALTSAGATTLRCP